MTTEELFLNHVTIDLVILFENSFLFFFSEFINGMEGSYEVIVKIIWITYGLSYVLKIIFYFVLHPWSLVIRHDIISKNPSICIFQRTSKETANFTEEEETLIFNRDDVRTFFKIF